MNRLNRILMIAVLALTPLAGMVAKARAQDPPPAAGGKDDEGGGTHRHRGMSSMKERLNLTAEQVKKIEDIQYNRRKRAIQSGAELETAQLELGRLMRADTPDQRAINAQIDKLSQLRASLAKDRVAGMFEVRGVLTPEQLKQWRGMQDGMRGFGPGMPGMRGGMRHGMRGQWGSGDDDGPGEGHGDTM